LAIEDDLNQLESSIRQLQIEWEKFFSGLEKKAPTDLKGRVEGLVRRYAYSEIRNNGERFRYQSLAARYHTFAELWAKRQRASRKAGRSVCTGRAFRPRPRRPRRRPPPPRRRRPRPPRGRRAPTSTACAIPTRTPPPSATCTSSSSKRGAAPERRAR